MARKRAIADVLRRKSGVLLDISLGGIPQANSVSFRPGGDIDANPRELPFPIPTGVVHTAVATHVVEFIDPSQFFAWWDEMHRIMRPLGIVYISGPYGADDGAMGWLSDPQHKTRVIDQSFAWLDPRLPYYGLHKDLGRPTPKPWHPLAMARVPGVNGTISYNCTLSSQPFARNGKGGHA